MVGNPFRRGEVAAQVGRRQVICLMVKDTVYSPLGDRLLRWKQDKERLGAEILVKAVSNESPSVIRSFLKNVSELVGCLMVGDIPYVEYEWNYTSEGKEYYDRFPSDHYYMDLNGDWADSNGNGIYDKILGDLAPEIWVGRLKASNLSGNEIELLQHYFDKNHAYLTGELTMPDRALLYVDEVTDYYVNELAPTTATLMGTIYPDVVSVYRPEYTNASDYLTRLRESWSLVRLIVHSGGFGHHFLFDGKWDGKVYPSDIKRIDPKCFFYLITSCSNFDYRQRDHMGGWYLFGSYGLLAIGDSSVRDILVVLSEEFFSALKNECFGVAYLRWAKACVMQRRNAMNIINYVLLGDPSLGIARSLPLTEFSTHTPLMAGLMLAVLITISAFDRRRRTR